MVVLNLLRDKSSGDVNDTPNESNQNDNIDVTENTDELNNFNEVIPPNIKKFLNQGKVLRIYGDDKVCRSMHVYLSKDMGDLKCKHPKENFVK